MEIIFVLLNVIAKVSMFVILLLPVYILSFYLLKFVLKFLEFYNINTIKVIALTLSIIIILTNVKFLDVYWLDVFLYLLISGTSASPQSGEGVISTLFFIILNNI